MSSSTRSTFRLSGARVSWGVLHETCVTPGAVTLTGGEYLELSSLGTDYYVWFDLDNGSVDPAPAGRTGIEVDLATGYSFTDLASAMETAIEAVVESTLRVFSVRNDGTNIFIRMEEIGAVNAASADNDTGFDVAATRVGLGGDLGATSGGVSVEFDVSTLDITSDQGGTAIQDRIIQGVNATASMSLLEMDPAKWKLMVGQYAGDTLTPGGGSEVVGFGESKNFSSSFENGGLLNLHPLDRDASDRSEDVTFWIATPVPGSYNFSGEEVSVMEVEFAAIPDRSRNDAVNIFVYGDYRQDLDA